MSIGRCPDCGAAASTGTPVAHYKTQVGRVNYNVLLFAEKLVLRYRYWMGSSYELPYPLERIDPDVVTMHIRDPRWASGLALAGAGGVFIAIIHGQRLDGVSIWVTVVLAMMCLIGFAMSATSMTRIEWAAFREAGRSDFYIFQIPRGDHRESESFDDFIAAVRAAAVEAKRKQRDQAQNGAVST